MTQPPRAAICSRSETCHPQSTRATAAIAKRLQEGLCYGQVARRAPMTVGKKMNRIGGHVVEIDADIRKLAKDCRGNTAPWPGARSRASVRENRGCLDGPRLLSRPAALLHGFDRE